MGTLSFLIPEPLSPVARKCVEQASLAGGYDLTPVPTRRKTEGGKLLLTKDANESGYLLLPWPIPGQGCPATLSATLRERSEPYDLLLELARGKLNHVRTQTAEWESIGLVLDPEDRAEMREATRAFGQAVIDPSAPEVPAISLDVLTRSHKLADRIARVFADQLLNTRLNEGGRLSTGFGTRLSRLPDEEDRARLAESFNSVRLVPEWGAIEPTEAGYDWAPFDELVEWAMDSGLRVSIGPLLDLDGNTFPPWLRQWAGDLPTLTAFMCDFAETVVRRYDSRVLNWQVLHGFNHTDALGLTEDERLRLAARILDSVRQVAPDCSWSIGLAEPWGDYLRSEDYTYSPLVFADTLLRAGFTFSAVELELRCGIGERHSMPRDGLDCYRLFELFGVLGIPLEVVVWPGPQDGPIPDSEQEPPPGTCPPGWAGTALAVALSLPQVQAVYWNDSSESAGGGSGSGNSEGTKVLGRVPALLRELRERFLGTR